MRAFSLKSDKCTIVNMLWLYVVDNEVKVSNFCYYCCRCRVIILRYIYSAKYNKYSEKMSSFRLNSLILWVVLVLEFVQDLDGLEIDLGTSSTSWTVKNTEFKVSKAPYFSTIHFRT